MSAGFRLSLAIPLHNEESVLPELLRRTLATLDALAGGPHELLFVDDGSTDRSAAMVEEATAAAANLKSEAVELTNLVGRFQTGEGAVQRGRPQIAQPGRHAPARNPVARSHAKIAASVRSGGGRGATAATQWEEF